MGLHPERLLRENPHPRREDRSWPTVSRCRLAGTCPKSPFADPENGLSDSDKPLSVGKRAVSPRKGALRRPVVRNFTSF
jgi:hypothetical protein